MYHVSLAKLGTVPEASLTFRSPALEPVRYSVECIPARTADGQINNWTLKQLDDVHFQSRLREALPDEERTFYAPSVNAMSGVVLPHRSFSDIYELDRRRRIVRPGFMETTNKRVPCDGTFIERTDGFIMSAGGCPCIVLSGRGANERCVCLASHAGRDCLIDPYLVRKGKASRVHESVIEGMIEYAKRHFGAEPKDLILRSFFSLPWHAFPHDPRDEEHREVNTRLHTYLMKRGLDKALISNHGEVCLSLNVVIELQSKQLGIGRIETGLLGLPENGDYAYTRHKLPELKGAMRNLVLMYRHQQ